MKRKFGETCVSSYTEARSLVFNISLGKLHSNSPKSVEPSLWRSLLIVKTLHRITEELKIEASGTSEAVRTDKVVKEVLGDEQLDALFLFQSSPVAILLSELEDVASSEPTSDDCGMQVDDSDEQFSWISLGTNIPWNSDDDAQELFPISCNPDASIHRQISVNGPEALSVHNNFDSIDYSCLDFFSRQRSL